MFASFNYEAFKPQQEILDKCYRIELTKNDTPLWKIRKWCLARTDSFIWIETVENEDAYLIDEGDDFPVKHFFYFYAPQDVLLFKLKWL